jgi:hypothetical protein
MQKNLAGKYAGKNEQLIASYFYAEPQGREGNGLIEKVSLP